MRLEGSNEAVLLQQLEGQAERCRDVVETMLRLSEPSSELEKVKEHGCQMLLNEVEMMVSASFQHKNIELVIVSRCLSDRGCAIRESRLGAKPGPSVSTCGNAVRCVVACVYCTVTTACGLRVAAEVAVASGASKDDGWHRRVVGGKTNVAPNPGNATEPEAHSLDWKLPLPRAHR